MCRAEDAIVHQYKVLIVLRFIVTIFSRPEFEYHESGWRTFFREDMLTPQTRPEPYVTAADAEAKCIVCAGPLLVSLASIHTNFSRRNRLQDAVSLECGHFACVACTAQHVRQQMIEKLAPFRCVVSSCPKQVKTFDQKRDCPVTFSLTAIGALMNDACVSISTFSSLVVIGKSLFL